MMTNFLLLIFSAICSAFLLRKISPFIFGDKKTGTHYEKFLSTLSEQRADKQFQRALNTTPKKALMIWSVNCAILLFFMALSVYLKEPYIFKNVCIYAVIGLVCNGLLRVIKANQLIGLNFISRLEIRLFNAWFFPAYIAYISIKKFSPSGEK